MSRRAATGDFLSNSLTDLMTSLMVIFILLLVVFVNNRAAVNELVTDSLFRELKQQLVPNGFSPDNIRHDEKDRYSIVITVPDQLMTFKTNEYELKPEGEAFLRARVTPLATLLCGAKYRGAVESVVVEGHSDSAPDRGATIEESQNLTLKLSQDRSMEVVKKTLSSLHEAPAERACLMEKLSATGRGEQDLEATADKSRRVVFKIRVNTSEGSDLVNRLTRILNP